MSYETQSIVDQIGLTAGNVWHVLDDEGAMSLSKLTQALDDPRDRVMQAVGWLARENKIRIEENKRVKTIAINYDNF